MNPNRRTTRGTRPVSGSIVLRELRLAAEALGPWEGAADAGAAPRASLRQIAYLFVGQTPAPIDEAVEVVLGGFAAFLAERGEPHAIDFR